MPRIARIVAPGYPHHIVQRGNRRMDVFFSDADYLAYIDFLCKACQRYDVQIWSYCLMTNHAHFIAIPKNADSLARCFADAHVRYTRMINKRENWTGHLWQARFGSSVLDEKYLIAAVRYVERNPVRASLVNKPWEYRWSSASLHMDKTDNDPLVSGDKMLRELIGDWRKYLRQDDDPEDIGILRREVTVCRPAGTETFIKRLEKRLGCTLLRQKAGRPLKKKIN
ncbi:MAG: transposase [Syntrophaceae bacterium]|nr:transposase [Syntrophaceae bacterium]